MFSSLHYYYGYIVLICLLALGFDQFLRIIDEPKPLAIERPMVKPDHEPIQPIPRDLKLDPEKVTLGEQLFHDPILSHNNSIACSTCHDLATGGTDRLMHTTNGASSGVNTPTVFNSSFNFKQYWDGRAATLEDQIESVMHSASEMATNWTEVIAKLKASENYAIAFAAAYGGIQAVAIRDAIATFVRSLYTPDSRFDQFLRGDEQAISEDELAGYGLFKTYGCISCHQGIGVGGNLFQKVGMPDANSAERANMKQSDLGRYNVTGNLQDRFVFKVPGLRNVAITPPYFHDGSVQRLEEAVERMAKRQLHRQLLPAEVDLIVKFLHTLTGTYKGKPL